VVWLAEVLHRCVGLRRCSPTADGKRSFNPAVDSLKRSQFAKSGELVKPWTGLNPSSSHPEHTHAHVQSPPPQAPTTTSTWCWTWAASALARRCSPACSLWWSRCQAWSCGTTPRRREARPGACLAGAAAGLAGPQVAAGLPLARTDRSTPQAASFWVTAQPIPSHPPPPIHRCCSTRTGPPTTCPSSRRPTSGPATGQRLSS
jgi:hypothetical protein